MTREKELPRLLAPYTDEPKSSGLWLTELAELAARLEKTLYFASLAALVARVRQDQFPPPFDDPPVLETAGGLVHVGDVGAHPEFRDAGEARPGLITLLGGDPSLSGTGPVYVPSANSM